MPALPLSNSFDGGTDGVAVSVPNSGGVSGDAFTAITGTACVYTTANSYRGGVALRVPDPAAAAACNWTGFGSLTTAVYFRLYAYYTALPTVNNSRLIDWRDNANAFSGGVPEINLTGKVQGRIAAGSATAVGSVTIALNQWIRIEGFIISSATAGQIEWKYWSDPLATGVPDDTVTSAASLVLGANTDGARIGQNSTPPTAPFTVDIDGYGVNNTGYLGPLSEGNVFMIERHTGYTTR